MNFKTRRRLFFAVGFESRPSNPRSLKTHLCVTHRLRRARDFKLDGNFSNIGDAIF